MLVLTPMNLYFKEFYITGNAFTLDFTCINLHLNKFYVTINYFCQLVCIFDIDRA